MHKKFLYLDFDGVLHPNAVTKGDLFCLLPLLSATVANRNISIVISSSWRLHESMDYFKSLFSPQVRELVIGCTEELKGDKWQRWSEIKKHAEHYNISDWVVLDDALEMFPMSCKNLVLYDGSKGLQKAQLDLLKLWIDT